MKWQTKSFDELSVNELYAMLQLRAEVFSVEQNCVYQDCDGYDQKAHHVMGWEDDKLIAYARFFPPGVKHEEDASGGRFVTSPSVRGKGVARELMEECLKSAEETFGKVNFTVSAQSYLEQFYENYSFTRNGEPYLEDDIPHIQMQRKAIP